MATRNTPSSEPDAPGRNVVLLRSTRHSVPGMADCDVSTMNDESEMVAAWDSAAVEFNLRQFWSELFA